MKKEKISYGSVKRFGTRYGWTLKQRFGEIEEEQRKFHKCPYCHKLKVKRISAGIWNCRKCNATFTGKAYTLSKIKKVKALTEEDIKQLEAPEESEEESRGEAKEETEEETKEKE